MIKNDVKIIGHFQIGVSNDISKKTLNANKSNLCDNFYQCTTPTSEYFN